MELFIGHMPQTATADDLKTFFGGYGRNGIFKIVEEVHDDGSTTRYGWVYIESDRRAQKAIKKLDRTRLQGRLITVREYAHRAAGNDRRALNWRTKPWAGIERRLTERRRVGKINQTGRHTAPRFHGYATLATKH